VNTELSTIDYCRFNEALKIISSHVALIKMFTEKPEKIKKDRVWHSAVPQIQKL